MAGSSQPERRHRTELRRLELLDELRGRLRAVDFDCLLDPTGSRRDELCAVICRQEREPGCSHVHSAALTAAVPDCVGFGSPCCCTT